MSDDAPGPRPLRFIRMLDGAVERDIDAEIAFHLESRARSLMTDGHTAEEAWRIAEAEFGDPQAARRELASVDRRRRFRERLGRFLESVAQDMSHAARSLRRSPAFTATGVATLAIGMAAALTTFTLVDHVLLRPLPFRDPQRLVGVWHDFPPLNMKHGAQAAVTYWTYAADAHTIDGIAIYHDGAANVGIPGRGAPQRVTSAASSATLFPVLGVPPLRGRVFSPDDDRPGAPPVVLISEGLWRSQFGADTGILGKGLEVDGVASEIVGIMPRTFRFPSAETAIWTPLGLDPLHPPFNAFRYYSLARLKPGVSIADAARDFATVLPRVTERFPLFVTGITTGQMLQQIHPVPVLTPLRDDVVGDTAGTLWVVAAAAALLLLVAGVNVANLAVVRADARQREMGVREALGAGRTRVARYHLSEGIVLAALSGIAGLGSAFLAVRALVAAGPEGIPRVAEVTIDARALLVATVLAVGAALGTSLIPMFRARRGDFALGQGARGSTHGPRHQRLRAALVGAQIALGVVSLCGSGLLLRSFTRLHAVRPGFDGTGVETFWVSLTPAGYPNDTAVTQFYTRLIDAVDRLPGVESAAVTSRLPFVPRGMNENPLYPEGQDEYASKLPPLQLFTVVGGDYFRALRIPLLAGRTFDRLEAQRDGEAVISRRTAEMFWHDSTGVAALGQRFRPLPARGAHTVIGVVADVHDSSLANRPAPTVYFPEVPRSDPARPIGRTMALLVRTTGDPDAIAPSVERVVRAIDPALPTFDVRPMDAVTRDSTARLAFIVLILGGAAGATLTVGAVGLYGVMAYVVTLRRREMGIRLALGASPRGVARAVTREGLVLAAVGALAGLAVFAIAGRFMRGMLFGVAPWDPVTLGGALVAILAIAALASWIPARRAGLIDPAEALRVE